MRRYDNNANLQWIIPAGCSYTSGFTVTLTFTTFATESGYDLVCALACSACHRQDVLSVQWKMTFHCHQTLRGRWEGLIC